MLDLHPTPPYADDLPNSDNLPNSEFLVRL